MGCSRRLPPEPLGEKDVVLLEQGRLTSGTTWHAAGLVGQLRAHESMTRLIRYSTELYSKLEAETGLGTGWKQCGSLAVARTSDRMIQLKRTAAVARAHGVDCDVISVAEAAKLYPIMATDDLQGAVWLPGDGKANPADLTLALAKGARNRGVKIFENVRVAGLKTSSSSRTQRVSSLTWRSKAGDEGQHRRRNRRVVRWPVVARGCAPDQRQRAAFLLRALLHRHRPDRGRASRSAGAA